MTRFESGRRISSKNMFFDSIAYLKIKGIKVANDTSKSEREEYKKIKSIQGSLQKTAIEEKISKTKIIAENHHFDSKQTEKLLKARERDKSEK